MMVGASMRAAGAGGPQLALRHIATCLADICPPAPPSDRPKGALRWM